MVDVPLVAARDRVGDTREHRHDADDQDDNHQLEGENPRRVPRGRVNRRAVRQGEGQANIGTGDRRASVVPRQTTRLPLTFQRQSPRVPRGASNDCPGYVKAAECRRGRFGPGYGRVVHGSHAETRARRAVPRLRRRRLQARRAADVPTRRRLLLPPPPRRRARACRAGERTTTPSARPSFRGPSRGTASTPKAR